MQASTGRNTPSRTLLRSESPATWSFENEPVSGYHVTAVDSCELAAPAVGADDRLASDNTRTTARHSVGRLHSVLTEDRKFDGGEKLDFPHQPVTTAPAASASRVCSD